MSETQVAITRYERAGDQWTGEPDETFCNLCHGAVGWVTGDAEIPSSFHPVVSVQITGPGVGDLAATHFCEDCYGWLEEVAPAIIGST